MVQDFWRSVYNGGIDNSVSGQMIVCRHDTTCSASLHIQASNDRIGDGTYNNPLFFWK